MEGASYMSKSVTVIHAKKSKIKSPAQKSTKQIRVAAYCRVSTDQDEQLNSFENQVAYYTMYIHKNPDYVMAGIYADEGISGTNTKKRKEFQRMIEDCRARKIDMVITKSISRFARNTQDCLAYSRELKKLGIGILFEKENIFTLDASGELLFTILSSLAQEESRNISENCKWGIRSKFQKGIPHINTYKFMGYDKSEDGRLVINPKEAELVRRIFREFEEGFQPAAIAKRLNEEGVPGVSGEPRWIAVTIRNMLQQEKYMGDSLLQKTYTSDFLTKRQVKNEGEIDQYYVENSHPAIIPKEEWEAVKLEFERLEGFCTEHRIKQFGCAGCDCPYTSKVICGNCGDPLRRLGNRKSGKVWNCRNHVEKNGCQCDIIKEEAISKGFVIAWNSIVRQREKFLAGWEAARQNGDALEKMRARQMIELTAQGRIEKDYPELVQMVIEKVVAHSKTHLSFHFLDGTVKEVCL